MSTVRITSEEYRKLMGDVDKGVHFGGELPKSERLRRRKKAPKVKAPPLCDEYQVVTEPVTIRLPFPPALNHYYRVTSIAGHASLYIDSEGTAYRKLVVQEWPRLAGRITYDGRLAVRIVAVFPDERERDLDGLFKAVLDALQHAGAYRNDSQIKLLIAEQDRTEKPGWLDITIGLKPGADRQSSLFATKGW